VGGWGVQNVHFCLLRTDMTDFVDMYGKVRKLKLNCSCQGNKNSEEILQ